MNAVVTAKTDEIEKADISVCLMCGEEFRMRRGKEFCSKKCQLGWWNLARKVGDRQMRKEIESKS